MLVLFAALLHVVKTILMISHDTASAALPAAAAATGFKSHMGQAAAC
jgi:hypothetical protein